MIFMHYKDIYLMESGDVGEVSFLFSASKTKRVDGARKRGVSDPKAGA